MEYKRLGASIYVRLDKEDEVITSILNICRKENILSASYSGIGGCGDVIVSTYVMEKQMHIPTEVKGLLEMVSLTGSITTDENGEVFSHAHAMFSYFGEDGVVKYLGGHLEKAVILLTGEIVINPVENGVIKREYDEKSGLKVWKF